MDEQNSGQFKNKQCNGGFGSGGNWSSVIGWGPGPGCRSGFGGLGKAGVVSMDATPEKQLQDRLGHSFHRYCLATVSLHAAVCALNLTPLLLKIACGAEVD